MRMRAILIPLSAVVVLGGCVTVPMGPAVRVMPGAQKTIDQFQVDDNTCRQFAEAAIGGPNAAQPAENAAAANAVAGTLIGAAVGAALGSVTHQAGQGAAWGAGTGLLFGSAAGANSAGYSSYAMQRSYDSAYMQCMYSARQPGSGLRRVPQSAARIGCPCTRTRPASAPPPAAPPENTAPPGYTPGVYPPPNTPPPRS